MRKIRRSKTGQALVEFALAATLIFFLLAAAVDLGLIFFSIQGLHNAAQEGAAYGSRWLIGTNPRTLDLNAIRERVRKESGSKGGIGFVNLLDLNNDGIHDVGPDDNAVVGAGGTTYQNMPDGTRVIDNFIQIQLLADTNTNGDPMDDLVNGQPTVCVNPAASTVPCFIRVTVNLNYNLVFPLSPSFLARTVPLHSSYIVRLRDSYSAGGTAANPPVFATVTPAPTPTPVPTPTPEAITVTIQKYFKGSGSGSQPVYIVAKVTTQGGQIVTGASVSATFGSNTVNLTGTGNGIYANCSTGVSVNNLPSLTVTANSNGASNSTSTSSTSGSTCP